MSKNAGIGIGADALLEVERRREAKADKGPGLSGMSEAMKEEKKRLLLEFHTPVKARDGHVCIYCALFFHRPSRPAAYGDHMLTKRKWPELKFFVWVGAGTCDFCNGLRDLEIIKTCIVETPAGVIQCARYDGTDELVDQDKKGIWYARRLFPSPDGWKGRGDQVDEFKPVPAAEAERLGLRNNVLLKEAA